MMKREAAYVEVDWRFGASWLSYDVAMVGCSVAREQTKRRC
jgi:hypothetical protein